MIGHSQCVVVLEDQLLDPAQVVRPHTPVAGQPHHRLQPEFALTLGGADMDVGWFVALIGKEMKPK
jgi:hypothetical protein